jgi:hypothetical protein
MSPTGLPQAQDTKKKGNEAFKVAVRREPHIAKEHADYTVREIEFTPAARNAARKCP